MNGRDVPKTAGAEWIKLISAGLVFPVLLAMLAWNFNIHNRVMKIEDTQFTREDGALMMEKMNIKVDKSEVPPAIVIQRLDRLEKDIQELKNRLEKDIQELKDDVKELLSRR